MATDTIENAPETAAPETAPGAPPDSPSSTGSSETLHENFDRWLTTPFLLRALRSLEPKADDRRREGPKHPPHYIMHDLRFLDSLAMLLVTHDDGEDTGTVAVSMRTTGDGIHFYYARGHDTTPAEREYAYDLLDTARRIAGGDLDQWAGERELFRIVCTACADKITSTIRKLGAAPWSATGTLTAKSYIDRDALAPREWDAGFNRPGDGTQLQAVKCSCANCGDTNTRSTNTESQTTNLQNPHEVKAVGNNRLPDRCQNEESRFVRFVRARHVSNHIDDRAQQEIFTLLLKAQNVRGRLSWERLVRLILLARIIVSEYDMLEPLADLTEGQLKYLKKLAAYADTIESISRRALTPGYKTGLLNATILVLPPSTPTVPPCVDSLTLLQDVRELMRLPRDPPPRPPPATVFQIITAVETQYYGDPVVTPATLKAYCPTFTDKLWTYDVQTQFDNVHAEAALGAFLATHFREIRLPSITIGTTRPTCWACSLYLEAVRAGLEKAGLLGGKVGAQVFNRGCSGRVPPAEKWMIPDIAGPDGECEAIPVAFPEAVLGDAVRLAMMLRMTVRSPTCSGMLSAVYSLFF
ncbi:hypothetical protein Dda_8800 [Drechslerella dactyloides]|uniref:Uncharacterized protein n=1 Tax=Drechslerella dactyloides TaxID=74499 RepID=A0AAD6ITU9_DREDA|nr:hypothetical protein Dda_8800 [Drechslerella dactyloides]